GASENPGRTSHQGGRPGPLRRQGAREKPGRRLREKIMTILPAISPPLAVGALTASPTLTQIQQAGLGQDPKTLLSDFEEFRRLRRVDRNRLASLWEEHDQTVRVFRTSPAANPEYFDPSRPDVLCNELADFLGIPVDRRPSLIALHQRLRESIASE